jgi:hypothetical protein
MSASTHNFGFAGQRTVRLSLEEVSLDTTSEFLHIRVRVIGPRPIVQFQVRGDETPIFTQDDMRLEDSTLEINFPLDQNFTIRQGFSYVLGVQFAGAMSYDVLIEKMSLPEAGPAHVVEVIRDTSLTSSDVRDWFPEMFTIL